MSRSARLVQSGEGDRRFVVLLYLIHPDRDAALREALGPKPMILARTDDGDPGPGLAFEEAHAREAIGKGRDGSYLAGLVLGGWSAGCSGVRKRLLESAGDPYWGPKLRALVLADGTHASLPPQPWQLDVWRPWVEKARGGEACSECDGGGANEGDLCDDPACVGGRVYPFVFAASHTYQTYVEHLPGGKAYTSTVNVLRALTGWPLDKMTGEPFGSRSEHHAGLHVESWASAAIDGPAHVRQQTEALPGMLARYVRPLVEAAIL